MYITRLAPTILDIISLRTELSNEAITQTLDTLLKGLSVASSPGSTGTRNSILTGEANVEDILLPVAIVTSNTIVGKAQLSQRDGSLPGRGSTVGITPDTVELTSQFHPYPFNKLTATYQLVIAHHGHHTQGLHPILLGIKGRRATRVTKHYVRVDVRIQIRDAVLLHRIHERRHALARGVIGAVTSAVVCSIAVDVHVVVLAAVCGAVEEDCTLDVAAVGEGAGSADAVGKAVLQLVLACSGLHNISILQWRGTEDGTLCLL